MALKEKDPSSSASGSQPKQQTLFGFFKKDPNQTPKSQSTPKPRLNPSTSSSATKSEPKNASKLRITSPATSEGEVTKKVKQNLTSSIPAKRVNEEESDEEEERVVSKKRVGASATQAIVIDSDDEDMIDSPAVKSKVSVKAAPPPKDTSESEDYFADELDDFIVDDETLLGKLDKPLTKKVIPTAKKAAPLREAVSAPMKASTSAGSIKTKSDLAKEKAKQTKTSNEKVFDFLANPKDADGIPHSEENSDPRTLLIPKSAWNSFTPFETQFWEIKQNHYDTVLFFQKGKFYELYENDALLGHQDFDLKLTDRVKMKMVGVPEGKFDFWAAKFLAQGHKVGRVDQSETALGAEMRQKDTKGKGAPKAKTSIVNRELKSVLTSGTIVDGSMLTDDLASHCVAIKEFIADSTTPPTFGVCVLDASTAEFSLSSFDDDTCRTQIETLIRQLKPKEIIHEKGNLSVSTLRMLRNTLSLDCQWTALKSGTQFLRAEDTVDELKKLFKKKGEDEDMEVEVDLPDAIKKMYDKPVAMAALGGMIWYLKQLNLDSELMTARNFNIYDPLSAGKALVLDGQTLAHIEVLQNSSGGIEGTLLQLLSRCVTPYGKRLFKIWLCSPLRDATGINDRLDAVEDLMTFNGFGREFDAMVKGLPDLERLLSRVHAKTIKRKDFLKVISSFETISAGLLSLAKVAENFKSTGIPQLLASTPDLTSMLEDITGMFVGGEAIIPVEGVNEAFEIVRKAVEDIEESLEEKLEGYQKKLKQPKIIFKDIGSKDIYQIQVATKTRVDSTWTKMSSTKDFDRYWSPEVEKLVNKLKEARERKTTVINDFVNEVFAAFDQDYTTWLQVIKIVSELDCLLSLSKSSAALGEPSVRPEIVESDAAIIEFDELRHPCVLNTTTDFIPNDVALGGDSEQMILLTGPNMAGKSTMLRMTCAAIIMAQLGCFVPAAKARIAPIDAIYSRMGANDFIFANASTFKVEMDDTTKILKKATPKSLVILDELGRGTSTYDGMAIAFAVLHRLATHVGCIGFFATHFTSLGEDFAYHPQIRLCNMLTDLSDETRGVVFLYKLVNGSSPKSYGPHVAAMAGLPQILVERATAISKQFEESSRAREREMRASESLALTSQADAAFLRSFVKMGIEENCDHGQLLKTLKIIRQSILKSSE